MSTPIHVDAVSNRWGLFQNRNFRMLWASQAISQIGDGLTKVALLWFVYQLTGSALKMTIIGLLQTIPPLILSPLMGVYLDRLPKKPVMVILDVIRAVLIALIPALYVFDALTLKVLFVLVFFTAIFSTAFGPALAASLPLLVKPSELMSANSLLQSTTNMGILIGPAICGVLIAWLGTQNVLYVDAATFLLSAMCLLPIKGHLMTTVPRLAKTTSKITQDLTAGMQFVFRDKPVLRGLLFTTVFYALGASAFIYVLPLFVNDHIEADPLWLGWLWSSMGGGMLITSFGLSCLRNLERKGRFFLMALSMVVGGGAVQILAHSHSAAWGFILVTIIGASTAAFTPIAWSIIQETTPNHLLGRVFTLINTASMAMASGGIVAFGGVADTFGSMAGISMISVVFLFTGVVVILSNCLTIQGGEFLPWSACRSSVLPQSKGGSVPIRVAYSIPLSDKTRKRNHQWNLNAVPDSSVRMSDVIPQCLTRAPPGPKKSEEPLSVARQLPHVQLE
ncbi:MAG: MFS transporter [Nitrospirales bacterium]